jgi:hypothetical protein
MAYFTFFSKSKFFQKEFCNLVTLVGKRWNSLCFIELIFSDVESHPASEVLEKGSDRDYWNATSEEECAISSFSTFSCYAATYFQEDEYCIAECTQMTTIPETVTLVNSSVDSTVLLRTHNKGNTS